MLVTVIFVHPFTHTHLIQSTIHSYLSIYLHIVVCLLYIFQQIYWTLTVCLGSGEPGLMKPLFSQGWRLSGNKTTKVRGLAGGGWYFIHDTQPHRKQQVFPYLKRDLGKTRDSCVHGWETCTRKREQRLRGSGLGVSVHPSPDALPRAIPHVLLAYYLSFHSALSVFAYLSI